MAASKTGARRAAARGNSLIEVIAAIAVMLIGAAGIAGLNKMGARLDGDGRRITRATAIAEDLAQQIELWPYFDPRLENQNATNDDDIGDSTFEYERQVDLSALVDHGEADLTAGGTTWIGIPGAELQASGYERYWNVSFNDPAAPGNLLDLNANGVADGKRIAIVVRYRNEIGWRRIVVHTLKVSNASDR